MLSLLRDAIPVSLVIALTATGAHAQEKPFDLHGIYLEGCTCNVVCTCDLKGGMAPGCQVMGALIISSGSYGGSDLSGAKIAFAVAKGWGRIYVQAADPAKAREAGALGRALMSDFGTVESVRDATIDLSGSGGHYTLTVDGGKVITLKTEPVLGADRKTAVTYTNYPDPLFHTILQGKTVSGAFEDGDHRFTLDGTNAFFNPEWHGTGKI